MTDTALPQSLQQWLTFIQASHPADMALGLQRVQRVAQALDVLSLPMPVITVAGTNGKGSTLRLMQSLAEQGGHRLGLFTSPHLHRFNERVRLPDGEATDAQLCQAFAAVEQARADTPLTYFEFATLAALWLFARSQADLVLLEVGLGGRLDAVNVVTPAVSVVTSVGLDHQDWLGDTREAIAEEKCGIARTDTPLVYGERDWPGNLTRLLAQHGARAVLAGRDFRWHQDRLTLACGTEYELPETVPLGRDNLACACQALALIDMAPVSLVPGAAVTLPGRCEHRRHRGVDVWLDVGHNVPAVQRFLQRLPACAGTRHLVFGMMADKPIEQVVALFAESETRWHLGAPKVPRAAPVSSLSHFLHDVDHQCHASVADATRAALQLARPGDQVIVFGSFHTVAESRDYLNGG